jgi:glycosyltransferase involved in cell wall biosynthesis
MAEASASGARVTLDGKFFRLGPEKFFVKGVTYGPFANNAAGEPFASREQTQADFLRLRELQANVLRVYYVPPPWLLDLAAVHGLKVLIDVPWNKHLCFLDSENLADRARAAVLSAVQSCRGHPAVFAYSVVNEISPDIVRWSGANEVADFIDELVEIAKETDPLALCTFGNFPPTEFLRPHNIDFFCFNVYLHQQRPFENYLARLQMIADTKPLILGEFGIDSIREGEEAKCEILSWQIETTFRAGAAGTIVYSFTDDWFRDNRQIEDWGFGLTTRTREPKPSFFTVQRKFSEAPHFPLPACPMVSVVVASYNGARTLAACLDSLENLNYPAYEVILVDDGSTDNTPEIAALHPSVRYLRHENLGLSAARNTGIAAATGEIVAFTDSDCRPDEDWLYFLVSDLLKGRYCGIGGHNFLPPEDSPTAAAVLVSPGGPAHVMLTDRLAEHIPGCNMAFYKWALVEIDGFDPLFRKAGDDVDVCWRLQQRGYRIGFSAGGFVWHYRRSTVRDYLKQQSGYGEAEALLVRKHPEYFNAVGASVWQGRIYGASRFGVSLRRPIIYHGIFASGFFQTLYRAEPATALMFCTSLEYHVLVSLPLLVLSVPFSYLLSVATTSVVISIAVCAAAAWQAELPRNKQRFWSRPLVAALFFLQPVWRGWARYHGRLTLQPTPPSAFQSYTAFRRKTKRRSLDVIEFWAERTIERIHFLNAVLQRLDEQAWQNKVDAGWSEFDVEIFGSRWAHLQLTTASEPHPSGRQLVRCRLTTTWSLPARVAFWSMLGFELLVIGVMQTTVPWIWMSLLTLWIFAWFLEQEQRDLQRFIARLLDEVAASQELTPV